MAGQNSPRRARAVGHRLHVFGVPTFIVGDRAVFVRLMTRPQGDLEWAGTVDRVIGLIADHPEVNEFKYTRISS